MEVYGEIEKLINEVYEVELIMASLLFTLEKLREENIASEIDIDSLYFQIRDEISLINRRIDRIDRKLEEVKIKE